MHSKAFLEVVERITEHAKKAREAEELFRNPKRYSVVDGVLAEDPEGDLVMYQAHSALVDKLKQEKEQVYRNGKANGGTEYSWRV